MLLFVLCLCLFCSCAFLFYVLRCCYDCFVVCVLIFFVCFMCLCNGLLFVGFVVVVVLCCRVCHCFVFVVAFL